eukprot:2872223-Rhodomonas_salina.3
MVHQAYVLVEKFCRIRRRSWFLDLHLWKRGAGEMGGGEGGVQHHVPKSDHAAHPPHHDPGGLAHDPPSHWVFPSAPLEYPQVNMSNLFNLRCRA